MMPLFYVTNLTITLVLALAANASVGGLPGLSVFAPTGIRATVICERDTRMAF